MNSVIFPGNPHSEEEQKKTIDRYFEIKENSEPGTVVLFGHGMHLVHLNLANRCWEDPENRPINKPIPEDKG